MLYLKYTQTEIRFQESQHVSFGKKETSLHIDVFLSKTNKKIH